MEFHFTKQKFKVAALAASSLLMGCQSQAKPSGHYEGTLLQATSAGIRQQPVKMDVSYNSQGAGIIAVESESGSQLLSLHVPDPNAGHFTLEVSGSLEPGVSVSAETGHPGCFADSASPGVVEFCADENQIYLEINNSQGQPLLTLSANHFAVEQPFQLETPASYTLSGAISQSLERNYGSRIEYEHYIEVKHSAKAAWLNLLPHLGISTVLSNLPVSASGLLGAIADLVPFAIPSNWFHAKQASLQAGAERDALILMQADVANEMEGLVYALERDRTMLEFYRYLRPLVVTALDKATQLYQAHQGYDEGSVLHLQVTINSMDLDMEGLNQMIDADRTAIAQELGLNNPEGVTDVALGSEAVPIESARALTASTLESIAISRAFELQQMDELIAVGKSQSKAVWFNWLDPNGDPTEELGPALGEKFAVSKQQVLELQTEREQTRQGIVLKVDNAVEEYNSAIQSYAEAKQGMDLEVRSWAYEISQLVPNSGLNTQDIEGVEQDWIAMAVRFQTIVTGFRVARSTLDRLLLEGFYSDLQNHLAPVGP